MSTFTPALLVWLLPVAYTCCLKSCINDGSKTPQLSVGTVTFQASGVTRETPAVIARDCRLRVRLYTHVQHYRARREVARGVRSGYK